MTGAASAQQRTFYNFAGRVVGPSWAKRHALGLLVFLRRGWRVDPDLRCRKTRAGYYFRPVFGDADLPPKSHAYLQEQGATRQEVATTNPQKVTFGELRASDVRDVLIYCRDHRCSRSTHDQHNRSSRRLMRSREEVARYSGSPAAGGLVTRETSLYRPLPTRLTPPFALPPAL